MCLHLSGMNKLMNKVALVTGITGFIGFNLVRNLLDAGWSVHGVIRNTSSKDIFGELKNTLVIHEYNGSTENVIEIFEAARPTVVFHLASLFIAEHEVSQVENLIESNVLFGCQILEGMAAVGCSNIVNTGTSWQFYHCTEYRPVNLYSATKQAFEELVKYYHDAHLISCVTLRLFDTYGSNDSRRKLIKIIVDAALQGSHLDLSPGDQILDLSHVDDVVKIFIQTANYMFEKNSPINECYFVSGERMTVKELVRLVSKALSLEVSANFGGRAYRNREVMYLPEPECSEFRWKYCVAENRLFNEIRKMK